jgi:hypothetical protein
MKRKLIALIGLLPWLSACQATQADTGMSDSDLKRKFRGISGVAVVLLGSLTEHKFITFTTDSGRSLGASSGVSQKTRQMSFYDGDSLAIPKTVRVKWREGVTSNTTGADPWLGGTIIGDYTVEVAQRIPQEVVDDLRRDPRGNLRIKFRLADDGVLFGWDIERRPGYDSKNGATSVPPVFSMTGGDFQEARLIYHADGKITKGKGWYIDKKSGQKNETDF